MNRYFTKQATNDYLNWQKSDKKTFIKINELIDSIEENGLMNGIGQPEQLRYFTEPTYSRRINKGDRLVYRPYMDNDLLILSCKGHYDDH